MMIFFITIKGNNVEGYRKLYKLITKYEFNELKRITRITVLLNREFYQF